LESRFDSSGVDKLSSKVDKTQLTMEDRFNQLMRLLDWKADKDDIERSEKRNRTYIDEIATGVTKFADKDEVWRKLLQVDKQIKKLLEMKTTTQFVSPTNAGAQEMFTEDAMLTKKPLGGVSCLACNSRIPAYHTGHIADFKAWKKLPTKDMERSTKYGPGFSKVISKKRQEQENSFETSPRNDDPRYHTLYPNSSSKALANDDEFQDNNTSGLKTVAMLAGYHDGKPIGSQAGLPEVNSHHFLPETIKGVGENATGQPR
jgi:hypothetical protein